MLKILKMVTRALPILLILNVCGCVSNQGKPIAKAEIQAESNIGLNNNILRGAEFKNESNLGTDNKGAYIAENMVINIVKENPAMWVMKTGWEAGKQIWKMWKTRNVAKQFK